MSLTAPDPAVLAAVEAAVPGIARARASDRLGLAHDASHYLLTPQAVLVPESAEQVAALLRTGLPLTFRSGGTSLSGQAVSEHLLVDTRRHFRGIEVLDGGKRVRVQPGAVLRQVNARLAPYGRKLGPDPASESACTIGGVVAKQLQRHDLRHARQHVPDPGVDDDRAAQRHRHRHRSPRRRRAPAHAGARPRGGPGQAARQSPEKSGLGASHPGAVLAQEHHGVRAEQPARPTTRPRRSSPTWSSAARAPWVSSPRPSSARSRRTGWPPPACSSSPPCTRPWPPCPTSSRAAPAAVELLDAESLRVARTDAEAGEALRSLAVAEHAALLVEWQESEEELLAGRERAAGDLLPELELAAPAALSRDAGGRAALWHIRKGLYASVAGARPSGTTALLEDVAVPVPALAGLCDELTALFARHRYERSVIFGHAKDGNLHFMLNERFDTELERYAAFTEDMVEAVLSRGGTLKAEHGTGRVMAPFVRRQYGDELYEVMREIKRLCDPDGTLNPGVVLTDRDDAHLRDLKHVVTVEPEVDRCVECGYCEPVCPSRDLTTTPRQRIVLRRELAAAVAAGDRALARELEAEYGYDAVDTCAVDGMCATRLPPSGSTPAT
ncbi:FAD-binding and (Fe-S)-binding domain-containing protein [Nonomuraea rubra]|uniref:FAD-binding and (Fe-S)-binding domain-containing protein n=1 Tax=Nonomuraea rubra TaxID=46180 RepID=UPI0031EC84CA